MESRLPGSVMNKEHQTTADVLLIRPNRFAANPETSGSNAFQQLPGASGEDVHLQALDEFDDFVAQLTDIGVRTFVFEDSASPHKPDAIFSNNWVSFHADGTVIIYAMEAENRRSERRIDVIESLSTEHGFFVKQVIDLSILEKRGIFLEGTGSLVLDRTNRMAYAAISSRTHTEALADFAQQADYAVTAFEAFDHRGRVMYHTNVIMSVGEKFALICSSAISDRKQRLAVLARLRDTGRTVIEISNSQVRAFAGNILELATAEGEPVVVMSETALKSLSEDQLGVLNSSGEILAASIDTIETVGGGSVRCMIAEIHLPRRDQLDS